MQRHLTLVNSWRRATTLIWRTSPSLVVTLCVLTCMAGVVPAGTLVISRHLIDAVVSDAFRQTGGLTWPPWLLLLGLLSLAAVGLSHSTAALTTLFAAKVANGLGLSVLRKAAELDLTHFERSDFYDTLQRAQRDGTTRPMAILTLQVQLVQHTIGLSTMTVVLLTFSWPAFVLLVAAALPQIWTQLVLARAGYNLQRQQTTDRRTQQYLGHLLTTSECVKEIILFRAAGYILARCERLFASLYEADKRLAIRSAVTRVLTSWVTTTSYVLFHAYVLYLASTGAVSIGQITLLVGSYLQCQADLNAVIRGLGGIYEHTLFIGHLWEYLNLRPRVVSEGSPEVSLSRSPSHAARLIEFQGVSFRYPGTERWVLRNLDLQVASGECLAIVGRNGCGKTTIAKLLCRLYDPDEGQILLDGVDVRRFNVHEYRELITAVFQDFSRYHLSVRENIGIARPELITNEAMIRRAATLSGAGPTIERLPHGYDTVLGTYFGRGSLLSGGEWQKMAIARALARESAIVLLDEPTVSLDPESEAGITEVLQRLSKGKICMLITQRLTHAAMADRVSVLEGGRVAEQGSHEDLVRLGGRYASFVAMQGRMYRAGACEPFAVDDTDLSNTLREGVAP